MGEFVFAATKPTPLLSSPIFSYLFLIPSGNISNLSSPSSAAIAFFIAVGRHRRRVLEARIPSDRRHYRRRRILRSFGGGDLSPSSVSRAGRIVRANENQ